MKLMVIDGNSILNRAYYGIRPLTTRDGLYTHAVFGFFTTLLDGLDPYITTDISRGRMINEANRAASYIVEETVSPAGEYVDGEDGFVEFHVDQQALMELVLGLFYEPA